MLALLSHLECQPHEKHFLLKFLLRYEQISKPLHSRQQLAAILGIPLTRCYQSHRCLSSSGLLEAHKRRGDLTTVFIVDALHSLWPIWKERLKSHPHRAQIIQLLDTHPVPVDSRQHQLTIPQRLLLISLLEEANEFGLVTGLSLKSMAKRTGVAKGRIKAFLRALREFGYIRHFVDESQGVSESQPLIGIYLLAPQHERYKLNSAAPHTLIFGNVEPNLIREQVRFVCALKERYRLDKRTIRARKQRPVTDSDGHSETSAPPPTDNHWKLLSWRYLNVVSRLINEQWERLEAEDRSEASEDLSAWVDQLDLEMIAAGLALNSVDSYLKHLKEEIKQSAFCLAIALKKALTSEVVVSRFRGRPVVHLLPSALITAYEMLTIEILASTYEAGSETHHTDNIAYYYESDEGELKEYLLTNPQLLKRARLQQENESKPQLQDFPRGYSKQVE